MEENTTTNEDLGVAIMDRGIEKFNQFKSLNEFRLAMQGFLARLQKEPDPQGVGKTPDDKAFHVYISYIEMTLDEYFFGLWSTTEYRWQVVQNEIVGSIQLTLTHPVSGKDYHRTGAAAIQIMVDKFPDEPTPEEQKFWGKTEWAEYRRKKNSWAIDVGNKKPNSLDMGFPKLKADCIKNAAISLGKLFGRDLNRDVKDVFTPIIKPVVDIPQELRDVIKEADITGIPALWNANPQYQNNPEFLKILNERKEALQSEK